LRDTELKLAVAKLGARRDCSLECETAGFTGLVILRCFTFSGHIVLLCGCHDVLSD